jgi:hypothetical protein
MVDPKNLSTIGRPIDIHYTTNKIITIIMGLALIYTFIMEYLESFLILESLFFAVFFSLSVFFCWALGRELDPEYDYSAFIGILFLFLPFFLVDGINLFFMLWLMFSLRMINRTTGKPAGIMDILLYLILTSLFSIILYPIIAILASLAFLFDLFYAKRKRINAFFALVFSIIFIISIMYGYGELYNPIALSVDQILFSAVSILFMIGVIATTKRMTTLCDTGDKTLIPRQVQAGQILAVITVLGFLGLYGADGFHIIYIVLSSFLGVALYRIGLIIKKPFPPSK